MTAGYPFTWKVTWPRTPARPKLIAALAGAEPQHRDDAERRPGDEEGERPAPAERRRRRTASSQIVATVSVKPTASCIVSAVPDVGLVGVLGDERRELRRVGRRR